MNQPALFTKSNKPPMPEWLIEALRTKTGGFRTARWCRCRECGELTLNGIDNDLCAADAKVDPTPLTPDQEITVILAGRATYNIEIYSRSKIHLTRRDHAFKLGRPSVWPIGPAHQCGARFPTFLFPPKPQGATDECPF